jgi:streptogramin lyase
MGGAALAAPVGALKQYKVPTANSDPRAITNGSDGNVWFTEGNEFTNSPAKIARVEPGGAITEFPSTCNFCILTDIDQGPGGILYLTSNDPTLQRFDLATETFLEPIPMPESNALGGELDVHGDDIWVTDFNGLSLWRYNITAGEFTRFPLTFDQQPADVVVDSAGDVWFTATFDSSIQRLDPDTGTFDRFPVDGGFNPSEITIASDGQIWFTSRFGTQGVGRVDPATGVVTTFATPGTGPQGIAASPDGTVWFTQVVKGNIARIDNAGVVTEAKAVKGSEPFGIIVAPNGDPWYTMMEANKVATLQLR